MAVQQNQAVDKSDKTKKGRQYFLPFTCPFLVAVLREVFLCLFLLFIHKVYAPACGACFTCRCLTPQAGVFRVCLEFIESGLVLAGFKIYLQFGCGLGVKSVQGWSRVSLGLVDNFKDCPGFVQFLFRNLLKACLLCLQGWGLLQVCLGFTKGWCYMKLACSLFKVIDRFGVHVGVGLGFAWGLVQCLF